MNSSTSADPFTILGVPRDAGEAEIRARYLELVKQFPPEREPERFREIRAAFEAARDPLAIARRLIERPDEDVPQWSQVIEEQRRNPPMLSPGFLLSLGNRSLQGLPPSGEDAPHDSMGGRGQDARTDAS